MPPKHEPPTSRLRSPQSTAVGRARRRAAAPQTPRRMRPAPESQATQRRRLAETAATSASQRGQRSRHHRRPQAAPMHSPRGAAVHIEARRRRR